MAQTLTRNWWLVALRGVAAVLFGIAAFVWPGLTAAVLVVLFGAYALVDGVFALATGVFGGTMTGGSRWFLVLGGLAGVIIGLITFFAPGITAITLLYFIGIWAIITGIFEVAAAIQLRQEINDEWLLIFGGILSVVFGLLVVVSPGAGALSIIWLIAFYALIYGIRAIVLGFRMRSHDTTLSHAPSGAS